MPTWCARCPGCPPLARVYLYLAPRKVQKTRRYKRRLTGTWEVHTDDVYEIPYYWNDTCASRYPGSVLRLAVPCELLASIFVT